MAPPVPQIAPAAPPVAPVASAAPVRSAAAVLPPQPTTEDPPERPAAERAPTYPLVVSFVSICCGTDRNAPGALERALSPYKNTALGEHRGSWGEEGEYDVCFTLAGLSSVARARLIAEVRANVGRKLVVVRENAPCRSGWNGPRPQCA
jgi:hypothetical protein